MRTATTVAMALMLAGESAAHPGSGIVVDNGVVYFGHTGVGIWKIDADGQLQRHEGPGIHWLALDPGGNFVGQRWPRYREHMRPGVIRYGDAEIRAVGSSPTLLAATSFPIAVGPNGALYYPDVGLEELVHIKRLAPGGRQTVFATLPPATEIAPNYEPWKALWIHCLAAGADGSLYYTEKEAVRRIDSDGDVTLVADQLDVPGCVLSESHRGGPILRGLDVTAGGTVYVAAMACGAVLRIQPGGSSDVVLRSDESWTPTGVAVSGEEVYVLEFWFMNPDRPDDWYPRVRKLSPDGRVTSLAAVPRSPQ